MAVVLALVTACSSETGGNVLNTTAESCMLCHNASQHDDYTGPGIENPHPFPPAENLRCTTCHGGNGQGETQMDSHVPPPPEIGDDAFQDTNARAYFNRLTLTGIDKLDDYEVDDKSYTALDYLQFVNPGDLRVVSQGKSCGQCHQGHVECVTGSMLATSAGIFSGAMFAAGVENRVAENVGLYEDTAADVAFRAVDDDDNPALPSAEIGAIDRLFEFPVYSKHGDSNGLHNNDDYLVAELLDDRNPDNSLVTGSALADLYHEQVAFTCGDCHLGSAGANNRTGDYRSSGCTACHMPYSMGGRSGSRDPNINKFEPEDPDDIDDPERPHVRTHMIHSVSRTLSNGVQALGIDDYTCAGCHQGSNRTVMQFWGIRLDQNEDVKDGNQYPAQPDSFATTHGDTRLFDPDLDNDEFNGRRRNQYLLEEDYDGDGRDDTPPDVHYAAGMGCIDCHGSHDLHGGNVAQAGDARVLSRMGQAVAIRCESCHGAADAYAQTTTATTYTGEQAEVAVDSEGNPLRHVVKESDGHFYMTSRLTGEKHFVKQTLDSIVDSGKTHPYTDEPLFNALASYAMGRDDDDDATGIGPQQDGTIAAGFSHTDRMDCVSCHASWTNTCIGCHLEGEYNGGQNFSNITGDRIVFREENADFVYQTPVHFQLGVSSRDKITVMTPNTEMWFKYFDKEDDETPRFAFSDRNGKGATPSTFPVHPALSHNAMMPHSIRGKPTSDYEGARNCASCHLTDSGLTAFEAEHGAGAYNDFYEDMRTGDFGSLDFDMLLDDIGLNTSNQHNSPVFVHMVAGLGSGLFLFDEEGCAVNPLDDNDDRAGCDDQAPSENFDPARVHFNLDRIVEVDGVSNASSNHPRTVSAPGEDLRFGADDLGMAGPLGATIVLKLAHPTTGIRLDAWIDADGDLRGFADDIINPPPD